MSLKYFSLLGLGLLLSACQAGESQKQTAPNTPAQDSVPASAASPKTGYRFDQAPAFYFELPYELREISGICNLDENRLLAINDEQGRIFFLNKKDGQPQSQLDFGPKADYEDLAIANQDLWILEANGTLYQIPNFRSGKGQAHVFELPLDEVNDCEGLYFASDAQQLWIAPKESGNLEDEASNVRSVFAFNLETQTFDPKPRFEFGPQMFRDFCQDWDEAQQAPFEKFLKKLYKEKKKDKEEGKLPFHPSALALHPLTGRLYVLAAVQRPMLAVFDSKGQLLSLEALPEDLLPQPEGLCFEPNGDLWISSEGGSQGHLCLFRYE